MDPNLVTSFDLSVFIFLFSFISTFYQLIKTLRNLLNCCYCFFLRMQGWLCLHHPHTVSSQLPAGHCGGHHLHHHAVWHGHQPRHTKEHEQVHVHPDTVPGLYHHVTSIRSHPKSVSAVSRSSSRSSVLAGVSSAKYRSFSIVPDSISLNTRIVPKS